MIFVDVFECIQDFEGQSGSHYELYLMITQQFHGRNLSYNKSMVMRFQISKDKANVSPMLVPQPDDYVQSGGHRL